MENYNIQPNNTENTQSNLTSVNPNEIFEELGLSNLSYTLDVNQSVGNIEVRNHAEDVESVEVEDDVPLLGPPDNFNVTEESQNTVTDTAAPVDITDVTDIIAESVDIGEAERALNSSDINTNARFSSASWFKDVKKLNALLIGAGGINSWTAFLLARTGVSHITIYDSDTVEKVNLAGQLFSIEDIGKRKVHAINSFISTYCDNVNLHYIVSRFSTFTDHNYNMYDYTIFPKIVICGLDNMESRIECFKSWKKCIKEMNLLNIDTSKYIFIDGRLAAEKFQIFSITGNNIKAMEDYEKNWLFSDAEAEEELCSYKQTTYCASMIASMIINNIVIFIENIAKRSIMEVPYNIYYDAKLQFLKFNN